jgi:hypothetical protein
MKWRQVNVSRDEASRPSPNYGLGSSRPRRATLVEEAPAVARARVAGA